MKTTLCIAAIMLFILPLPSLAGKIYGGIQYNGKAVASGASIAIVCGSQSYNGTVQQHGRYSINVPVEGRCILNLNIPNKGKASIKVVSYKDATRYNFAYTSKGLKRL